MSMSDISDNGQKKPLPQCTCMKDSFAYLPREVRPKPAQKTGGLRKVTCPGCGLEYWTNRKTDLCITCEKKGQGMKKSVLFLCTGNSCRSQMAEAIINARGGIWEAVSAGSKPAGYIHPKVLEVLAEIGIRHEGRSKPVDEFRGVDFDLVVTVCDTADEECPVWLGKGKKLNHSFPDPAKTDNIDDFRKVRDDMLREIIPLLQGHS